MSSKMAEAMQEMVPFGLCETVLEHYGEQEHNQGKSGSCVACAFAKLIHIVLAKKYPAYTIPMSTLRAHILGSGLCWDGNEALTFLREFESAHQMLMVCQHPDYLVQVVLGNRVPEEPNYDFKTFKLHFESREGLTAMLVVVKMRHDSQSFHAVVAYGTTAEGDILAINSHGDVLPWLKVCQDFVEGDRRCVKFLYSIGIIDFVLKLSNVRGQRLKTELPSASNQYRCNRAYIVYLKTKEKEAAEKQVRSAERRQKIEARRAANALLPAATSAELAATADARMKLIQDRNAEAHNAHRKRKEQRLLASKPAGSASVLSAYVKQRAPSVKPPAPAQQKKTIASLKGVQKKKYIAWQKRQAMLCQKHKAGRLTIEQLELEINTAQLQYTLELDLSTEAIEKMQQSETAQRAKAARMDQVATRLGELMKTAFDCMEGDTDQIACYTPCIGEKPDKWFDHISALAAADGITASEIHAHRDTIHKTLKTLVSQTLLNPVSDTLPNSPSDDM